MWKWTVREPSLSITNTQTLTLYINTHNSQHKPSAAKNYFNINASVKAVCPWISEWVLCASGCVVECRICNREVAGSNLGLGYFAPRSTQPLIPPGSVNEYQLRLGRQRQVWLIPVADERVGVQVKLWNPLRTRRAIPEHFCGVDLLRRGAIKCMHPSPLPQCCSGRRPTPRNKFYSRARHIQTP